MWSVHFLNTLWGNCWYQSGLTREKKEGAETPHSVVVHFVFLPQSQSSIFRQTLLLKNCLSYFAPLITQAVWSKCLLGCFRLSFYLVGSALTETPTLWYLDQEDQKDQVWDFCASPPPSSSRAKTRVSALLDFFCRRPSDFSPTDRRTPSVDSNACG